MKPINTADIANIHGEIKYETANPKDVCPQITTTIFLTIFNKGSWYR